MATLRTRMTSDANPVRAEFDHPVIDNDGHYVESVDLFLSFLDDIAGPAMVDRYQREVREHPLGSLGSRERGEATGSIWGYPMEARDLATAMVPGLLHERMHEFGFDFAVIYPTLGLGLVTIQDAELRQAAVRASNTMAAHMFQPYAASITPAATIPMHTPEEALEEIEHVVTSLGFKAALIPAAVSRPLPDYPDAFPAACHMDYYAIDSDYDYDPVWKRSWLAGAGRHVARRAGTALHACGPKVAIQLLPELHRWPCLPATRALQVAGHRRGDA